MWHSTDAYRRVIWRCKGKYVGEKKCTTPHVTQGKLEKTFVNVMQKVIREKDAMTAAGGETLKNLDTAEIDAKVAQLENEARKAASAPA